MGREEIQAARAMGREAAERLIKQNPKVAKQLAETYIHSSKREEIRDGMFHRVQDTDTEWREDEDIFKTVDILLSYLHSQDVVIKVERELPKLTIRVSDKFHPEHADMSGEWVRPEAGYVATEPLI